MPTKFRLTRTDFKLFSSQKARRIRGTFFTAATIPLPAGTPPKVACVVSKKVVRKAVDRNRIKRRCREALRQLMTHIKQSVALVLYANTTSNKATFEELSDDIKNLLQKTGLNL